jgi:hypothetical protein
MPGLNATPTPESLAALETGADLDDFIDLGTIHRVQLDLLSNSLVVEHAAGRERVAFATPEAADACFTRLWRRLGDGYQLTPPTRDPWALAREPLALLLGTLLMVAGFVLLLNVIPDVTADRTPLGRLNWQTVCAVGGAVAAVSQVWLYRRLTTPAVSLELRQSTKSEIRNPK